MNNTNGGSIIDGDGAGDDPAPIVRHKRACPVPPLTLNEAQRTYTATFTGITVLVRAFCHPNWSSARDNARLLGANRAEVHWGVFIVDRRDSNIFIEVFRGQCDDILDVLSTGVENALARTLALIKYTPSEADVVMALVTAAVREVQVNPVRTQRPGEGGRS